MKERIRQTARNYGGLFVPFFFLAMTIFHVSQGRILFSIPYFIFCMALYVGLHWFMLGSSSTLLFRTHIKDIGVITTENAPPYHYINIPSGELLFSISPHECSLCKQRCSRRMYVEDSTWQVRDDEEWMEYELACLSCHKKKEVLI